MTEANQDTYRTESRTMSLLLANLISIPLFVIIMVGSFALFGTVRGYDALDRGVDVAFNSLLIALVVFIASIVVHELLHAAGWIAFGGVSFDKMKFGFKSLTPYAHSQAPMPAGGYRIGTALPGLALGLVPLLVSLLIGSGVLAVYGAVMLAAASGDLMVLWMLRDVPGKVLVQDHPSEVGSQVLWPATE
ncbi:MAG: DUF3267 domain-containing protein [Anaerolineae bacterium]